MSIIRCPPLPQKKELLLLGLLKIFFFYFKTLSLVEKLYNFFKGQHFVDIEHSIKEILRLLFLATCLRVNNNDLLNDIKTAECSKDTHHYIIQYVLLYTIIHINILINMNITYIYTYRYKTPIGKGAIAFNNV